MKLMLFNYRIPVYSKCKAQRILLHYAVPHLPITSFYPTILSFAIVTIAQN
jgi:hypothetical protein